MTFINEKLSFLTPEINKVTFVDQYQVVHEWPYFKQYDGHFHLLQGSIEILYLSLYNGFKQQFKPGGKHDNSLPDLEAPADMGSITVNETIETDAPKAKKPKQKPRAWSKDYFRYRLHPSKVSEGHKYWAEPKSGTHIYWTNSCIEAYKNATEVDTFYIIEGEFKAFVAEKLFALKHIAAIPGIWGFTNGDREKDANGVPKGKHTLHDDLVEFLKTCKVKRLVYIQDADCFDITPDPNDIGKDLAKRPKLFSSSVRIMADLCRQLNVEVIFTHVNKSQSQKGLDDLLLSLPVQGVNDVMVSLTTFTDSEYLTHHFVSTLNSIQIEKLWSIDSIQSFYTRHKELLGAGHFTYNGRQHAMASDQTNEVVLGEGVKMGEPELVPRGADPDDFKKFGLWEYSGRYYAQDFKDKSKPISNFLMRVLYHVRTGDDKSYRLIEILNVYKHKAVIKVDTDDFISNNGFKKTVARAGNFVWKGTESQLANLQEKLQHDEIPTEFVRTLGWHDKAGAYMWANGMYDIQNKVFLHVDEYGIIRHNDINYFIPALSSMFEGKEAMYLNEKAFVYEYSGITPDEWLNQFIDVFGENGQIGFVFNVACLFRDVVFDGMRKRFPILNGYGKRGSGKGTLIERLMKLYGKGQVQVMLGGSSTAVGFMRKFAQFKNSLVWLDEYKNNLKTKVIESLKNLYDGVGYERGKMTNDFDTESTPILSGCILSGQEMPTIEPALYSRVIMLTFRETTRTEKQKQKFLELINMEKKGISHITCQLLGMRESFVNEYRQVHDESVVVLSKAVNNEDIDERFIQSYAFLLATQKLIRKHEIVKLPFTEENFIETLTTNLVNQFMIMQGSDDVSKFWEVVEQMAHMQPVPLIKEGTHYMLKDGILWIRMQLISGLYEKEMRSKGDANVLSKSTLDQYLTSDAQRFFARDRKQFSDGSCSHCIGFKYTQLGIDLIKIDDPTERLRKRLEMGERLSDEDIKVFFQHKMHKSGKPKQVTDDMLANFIERAKTIGIPGEDIQGGLDF